MAADVFFNQKISKRYINRVEAERFTMPKKKAIGIIRRKQAKVVYKQCALNTGKPSTARVEFTEAQMRIALAALAKGKQ